ncbi:hypothetical protein L9F63_001818, partial [Diploptera punctata]
SILKTLNMQKVLSCLYILNMADNFNLSLNRTRVAGVEGLQAELFYVREGVVNTYAMNFVVPVPAHISDLEFSWQSLTKHPLSLLNHLR